MKNMPATKKKLKFLQWPFSCMHYKVVKPYKWKWHCVPHPKFSTTKRKKQSSWVDAWNFPVIIKLLHWCVTFVNCVQWCLSSTDQKLVTVTGTGQTWAKAKHLFHVGITFTIATIVNLQDVTDSLIKIPKTEVVQCCCCCCFSGRLHCTCMSNSMFRCGQTVAHTTFSPNTGHTSGFELTVFVHITPTWNLNHEDTYWWLTYEEGVISVRPNFM